MFYTAEKQILHRIKVKSIMEEEIYACQKWIDFVFLFHFVPFTNEK